MSQRVSRRSVLKAASVGGVGLAGAGAGLIAGTAAGAYGTGLLPRDQWRRLPEVPEHVRPTDWAALGRDGVLKIQAEPALASRLVELRLSPGEELAHLGAEVHQFAAEFVCDPSRPNILVTGAQRVTYEIVEVAWQPGEGWPIYRSRSPHTDHSIKMRYTGVPRHQIVFLDDRAVYVGNTGTSGVIDGIEGPLRVDVNGDSHASHRGFYKILVTAIA